MEYVSFTRKEVADGKKLLARVLEKLRRERSSEDDIELTPHSAEANAMSSHLRVRNLKSIIIRKNKDGYWTADLLLKRVPHGVPDVIGVPEHEPFWPYKSRQDVLSMILLTIKGIWLQDRRKALAGHSAPSEPRGTDD
jgi:hypothetical protein